MAEEGVDGEVGVDEVERYADPLLPTKIMVANRGSQRNALSPHPMPKPLSQSVASITSRSEERMGM